MRNFYEPTGFEVIDSVKGLQLTADVIDDPDAKIKHVRNMLKVIGAGDILGSLLMISASEVWGKQPDSSGELIRFEDGLLFVGELDEFGYMLDPTIPLDSLSLNFRRPEVWAVDAEDALAFRALKLQVPVLAIDSCTNAAA